MPPPVTPSPHRFLAKKRAASPSKKVPKATSSLRNDIQQVDPDLVPQQLSQQKRHVSPTKVFVHSFAEKQAVPSAPSSTPAPLQAAKQFAPTPRFSHATPAKKVVQPEQPRANTFANVHRRREDVDDHGASVPIYASRINDHGPSIIDDTRSDTEEMLDALPTTELPPAETLPPETTLPFSPKRRRISPPAPRPLFRHPAPTLTATTLTTSARPSFVRPSPAPATADAQPLPEAFSPHRRGQKFVPGGMAATLQQSIIEMGRQARGQGYLRSEGSWERKVTVEACNEWLISGQEVGSGRQVRIALTGAGKGLEELAAGNMIGIRTPSWIVEVGGEDWVVGVDWAALDTLD